MATARKIYPKPPLPPPLPDVELRLDPAEAQVLADLVAHVGSLGTEAPRRQLVRNIYKALQDAGYVYSYPHPDMQGTVYIK